MKKGCLIPLIIAGAFVIMITIIILASILASISGYNKMVKMNENVGSVWANVEAQYQRRLDLIPNLVNTVQGYANFEKSTLTAVIEARAKATSVNINPDKLDENSLKNFQDAQGGLSSALSRLMVVVEQYPDLKANQNFRELQAQLEGTENRINVARMDFNAAAKDYNTYIQTFPRNIIAGMFGFGKKAYFQAETGAEKAPKVEFK